MMQRCNMACTFHGCKRTYSDSEALSRHIKDHQIPAESLPGKVYLCSTVGCDGSFSNMQLLMEHMREHHKPNYFFLCESCKAKLRSYRTLLKHLQTCAKVAKNKAAKAEMFPEPGYPTEMDASIPLVPVTTEPAGTYPPGTGMDEMESEPTVPAPHSTLTQSGKHPSENSTFSDMSSSVGPPSVHLTTLEPARPSAPNSELLSQAQDSYGALPPSLSPAHPLPSLPQATLQQQLQPSRVSFPNLPSSSPPLPLPQTPPGSNAVWRKNQDLPGPLVHRWNSSSISSQSLSRDEFQVSPLTAASYGSTPGGAIAAFNVATPPQTGTR